jgi:hypothetical protein
MENEDKAPHFFFYLRVIFRFCVFHRQLFICELFSGFVYFTGSRFTTRDIACGSEYVVSCVFPGICLSVVAYVHFGNGILPSVP